MRKKNSIHLLIILHALFCTPCIQAAAPIDLPATNGSSLAITVSRGNPNLLLIQGDSITGLTSSTTDIVSSEKAGKGAITFSTRAETPFTFIVETSSGQTFSVQATPVKGFGKSYRIIPETPVIHEQTKLWEQGASYETLLVTLNRGLITGHMPNGYSLVDDREKNVVFDTPVRAIRQQVWDGGWLRVEKYRLTNPLTQWLTLSERDYARGGVRSVMFWPRSEKLPSGASVELIIVREQETAK